MISIGQVVTGHKPDKKMGPSTSLVGQKPVWTQLSLPISIFIFNVDLFVYLLIALRLEILKSPADDVMFYQLKIVSSLNGY